MKRVLNGVHVLMAVGLIVALAACSGGSDNGLEQERDQALAAADAAEAAKIAAEAVAAQAGGRQVGGGRSRGSGCRRHVGSGWKPWLWLRPRRWRWKTELAGATPSIPELEAELAAANTAHHRGCG